MTENAPARPDARLPLDFTPSEEIEHVDDPIRRDISASALAERTLFVTCDETSSVERLVWDGERFGQHRNFNLAEYFDLPGGPGGEMDIEGLAVDGGYLWLTGSHSSKRDKPEPDENDREKALEELTDIDRDPNRYFLGRVPLERTGEGTYEPVAKLKRDGDTLRAACLKMKKGANSLMKVIDGDVHFGLFVDVPCKENGFDIEGLGVRDDRVFLGLRGPVLRGWAVVLELHLKSPKKGRLKPRKIGDGGARYRKHFVNLDGLGIRDLLFDGDDLLILAGPTMDLDGPVSLYCWPEALRSDEDSVTARGDVERILELPYGRDEDHAEGIVLWRESEEKRLLVVYDSPAQNRLRHGSSIDADVFSLE